MIARLLKDPDEFIGRGAAWELIPCYWTDLPLETIAPLFETADERITGQALYIISEVGPRACYQFLDQALQLLHSEHLKVRLLAYMCVVVGAIKDRQAAILHVFEGLCDQNHHVATSNLSYLAGLPLIRLQGAVSQAAPTGRPALERIQWLLTLPEKPALEDFLPPLNSAEVLTRRIGAVAAARFQLLFPELLDHMANHQDAAIAAFGKQQIKINRSEN